MANKISLSLSTIKADGLAKVMARVFVTKTNKPRIKTGISVNPKYFKNGYIEVPRLGRLNADEVARTDKSKKELDEFLNAISKILEVSASHLSEVPNDWLCNVYQVRNSIKLPWSWENIQKALEPKSEQEKPLNDFYQIISGYCNNPNSKTGRQLSSSRKETYHALARLICRYETFVQKTKKDKNFSLDPYKLTKQNLDDFFEYAEREGDNAKKYPSLYAEICEISSKMMGGTKVNRQHLSVKNRPGNTMHIIKFAFKHVYEWFQEEMEERDEPLTIKDPFRKVIIGKESYEAPIYLYREERDLLADFDFSKRPALDKMRDIFLFQALTGCRVSDMVALTRSNINNAANILRYTPQKTRNAKETPTTIELPLNDKALALISKYEGKDEKGRLFPFRTTHRYNTQIKEMLQQAGINRLVDTTKGKRPLYEAAASHLARRTLGRIFFEECQSIELTRVALGHAKGSVATYHYIGIESEDLRNTISKL